MTKVFDLEDIDKMFIEIEKDFTAFSVGLMSEYQERAIQKAPKETGALRNSIRAGVNTEVIVYDKGASGGDTAISTNDSTIKSGYQLGDTVNIVVGAPYGKYIEEGTSKTAPHAFLQSAAEELNVAAAAVKSQLNRYRK